LTEYVIGGILTGMTHPIKAWRERASFQAGAFAKAVGISYRTLHRIERGEVAPSLKAIAAIERVTGKAVTAADLIRFQEKPSEAA
jgi:DNA-binding XRE family transcriptional regulator